MLYWSHSDKSDENGKKKEIKGEINFRQDFRPLTGLEKYKDFVLPSPSHLTEKAGNFLAS